MLSQPTKFWRETIGNQSVEFNWIPSELVRFRAVVIWRVLIIVTPSSLETPSRSFNIPTRVSLTPSTVKLNAESVASVVSKLVVRFETSKLVVAKLVVSSETFVLVVAKLVVRFVTFELVVARLAVRFDILVVLVFICDCWVLDEFNNVEISPAIANKLVLIVPIEVVLVFTWVWSVDKLEDRDVVSKALIAFVFDVICDCCEFNWVCIELVASK